MSDLRARVQHAVEGRYAIERELGQGGMASVFLAQDVKHRRPVAVKVLNPEIARTVGSERFLREIEIAARLTHPHILPVFDSGAEDGVVYYVMPYIQGETLRHRLQREGQLPIPDALRIAQEIATALDYAHRQGIVHRDVKPENVLLEDGHAVVADFGVARAVAAAGDARLTQTGLAVGTPSYMSPEQSSGDATVDGRSDVYALGCVLHEMLTGAPPFRGATIQSVVRQHLIDEPLRATALRPDVPDGVQIAIDRALAKNANDRFATAGDFAASLAAESITPSTPSGGVTPPHRARGRRIAIPTALLAIGGVATALFLRGRPSEGLDPNLVAVAPFEVLVPDLELWREGLVDVVSRDLDGAGPLRTVAPTLVVRRWTGRADARSATALGQHTGARLAVFGQVLGSGGDSVRVNATLYDVVAGRSLGEFQVRDLSDRIDRVADSLTVALLRELGRTRAIGAVRLASIGSSSLPALKAFLRGEQFYRRTSWDSAIAYYERAIALDTAFAPALRRIGLALGWQRSGSDTLSRGFHLRAGAFNHGLAPRESLLVTADSLSAALYAKPYGLSHWSKLRRLFSTLDQATRRYPTDPEVWYALGDARFHFGSGLTGAAAERDVLVPFDRAIALDSAFGPSYIHPVSLALLLNGPVDAARYARPYLALGPQDVNAEGIRLLTTLMDARGDTGQRERLLEAASPEALKHAWLGLHAWPDSDETALAVIRALRNRAADGPYARVLLAHELLYRGHLREALRESPPGAHTLVAEAGVSGALAADSVSGLFARWFRTDWLLLGEIARWWATQEDTTRLREGIALYDRMARGTLTLPPFTPPSTADSRDVGLYAAAAMRAYLDLGRRDTSRALARFRALPDSLCHMCVLDRLTTAQLFAAEGADAEAAAILDRHRVRTHSALKGGLWAIERARVHERLGDRALALDDYRFVSEVWRHADPELQPFVEEARAAVARLRHERQP